MAAQVKSPPELETRDRILRTAFQLFHEQGFHATGVATIVREAGINPGSLYHFFEGKEQLLLQVLEFALGFLGPAVMEPVEAQTPDPIARVFALLAQYRLGMVMHSCRMGCPIGNLALEVSDGNPGARLLIHRNFENWARRVEGWLVEAGDRLPADLDRSQLAHFVLTVMEGGLMQARAADNLGAYDSSVAVLREHFDLLEQRARVAKRAIKKGKKQ
ncbi:MAG: TetR/AcrR family transcriptional regulator [Bryobacteraceae bacterium]|nr:TetR/AcrR family transcriptional regulator [Bryobacteraceae bacterium]